MGKRAERIFRVIVAFDVGGALPQKTLTTATEAGIEAVESALPEGARVRADGALGRARDGRRRIRVEITASSEAAEPAWVPLAQEAFAMRFAEVLARNGHDARRVT